MTQSYSGMRKGISLVEMMIAVILFGVISVVGFKYYKSFYNTNLAAKKARVAALMDQATQLGSAYDIYVAQFGTAPTAITDLTANNAMILTSVPTPITEIGAAGWALDTATDYTGAVAPGTIATDIAFTYTIDNPGAGKADNEEYCALFNNMIDTSLSVNVADATTFGTDTAQYAALGNAYCSGTVANTLTIVVLKQVN
ncbi:type IV pilin protein [Sulfuricurvum sp.]|uniref:type IV pilin protein n=1 Tax=Sulfuricurvum sp. TaxID=2025608 RepID=UPI003BB05618